MTTEYAHYLASLRLRDQLRWALAGCLATIAVRLMQVASRLLPERHPSKPYLEARLETQRAVVLPSVKAGVPSWAKRLGRGALVVTVASVFALALLGVARTSHHLRHRHDPHLPGLVSF